MCNLCRKWLTQDLLEGLDLKRFFEVGIGGGDLMIALGKLGLRGEGIDQSLDAVAACRQRILDEGLTEQLSVDERDLFSIETAEPYDLVVAYEVLEHIEDDRRALTSIWHLLKPRGYLLASVPAHMSKWGATDVWAGHVRRYERAELEDKLRNAGFEIIEIISYGYPLLNMTRRLRNLIYGRDVNSDESARERTARSGIERPKLGRLLQPIIPLYAWLVYQTERPFLHKDIGEGYLVMARRT